MLKQTKIFALFILLSSSPLWSADWTIKPGTLTVAIATEYPSLAYEEAGGIVGLEVDYARLIANELGLELVLNPTTPIGSVDQVLSGKADIAMGGIKLSPELSFNVHLTETFLESSQMAIVNYDRILRLSGPGQFYRADKTIGVLRNSTGERWAKKEFNPEQLKSFNSLSEALKALRDNSIDYLIHDATTSWHLARDENFKDLQSIYKPLNKEELVWAINKNNPILAQRVGRLLRSWRTTGILNVMNRRWIKARMEID